MRKRAKRFSIGSYVFRSVCQCVAALQIAASRSRSGSHVRCAHVAFEHCGGLPCEHRVSIGDRCTRSGHRTTAIRRPVGGLCTQTLQEEVGQFVDPARSSALRQTLDFFAGSGPLFWQRHAPKPGAEAWRHGSNPEVLVCGDQSL